MYAAAVNGQPLTFEVMTVHRRNMVMRDRQTGAIWQHATGEALCGPLRGARLEPLGGEQTRWRAWLAEYPHTTVAVETASTPQSIVPHSVLPRMLWNIPARLIPPGAAGFDARLPGHAEVVGLTLAGEARAYPLSVLEQRRVVEDSLGARPIRLEYDPAADRVRAFARPPSSGTDWEPVRAERQWWLAWSEFHPGTSIYRGPQDDRRE